MTSAVSAQRAGCLLVIEEADLPVLAATSGLLTRPFLAVWATWGATAADRRMALVALADDKPPWRVRLPPLPDSAARYRGDEAVWLMLFAETRKSGFDDIDTNEARYVRRHVKVGHARVTLRDLLLPTPTLAAGRGVRAGDTPLRVELRDRVLEEHLENARRRAQRTLNPGTRSAASAAEAAQRAIYATRNALVVRLAEHGLGAEGARRVHDDMERARHDGRAEPLYDTEAGLSALSAALDVLKTHYDAKCTPSARGPTRGAPVYWPPGNDRLYPRLVLFDYMSEFGRLPVLSYFASDAWARGPSALDSGGRPVRDTARDDGLDEDTELILAATLRAALARFGLADATYVHVIDAALGDSVRPPDPLYYDAVAATVSAATTHAHATRYSADLRVLPGTARGAVKARIQTIESFDAHVACGSGSTCDCEDCLLLMTLNFTARGRLLGDGTRGWRDPVLAAARRLARTRVVAAFAAAVTQAYVPGGDKAAAGTHADPTRPRSLPDVGSAEDQAAARDEVGHCHGLWVPTRLLVDLLQRDPGARPADAAATERLLAAPGAAAEWQRDAAHVAMLEGTGATDAFMLPAEEVVARCPDRAAAAAYVAKAAAVALAHAALHGNGPEDAAAADAWEQLGDVMQTEMRAYYVYAPRAPGESVRRRASTFYRGVVHAVVPDLVRETPWLAQLLLVDLASHTRGVAMDDLLRGAPTVAAVAPYRALGDSGRWARDIAPALAAWHNQMPEPAFIHRRSAAAAELDTPALVATRVGAHAKPVDRGGMLNGRPIGALPAGVGSVSLACRLQGARPHSGRSAANYEARSHARGEDGGDGDHAFDEDEVLHEHAVEEYEGGDVARMTDAARAPDVALLRLHLPGWHSARDDAAQRMADVAAALRTLVARRAVLAFRWTLDVPLPHTLNDRRLDDPAVLLHLTLLLPVGTGSV